MNHVIGEFISGVLVISLVSVLVRPGSQGPGFITAITGGFASIISAATNGPATSSTGTTVTGSVNRTSTPLASGNTTKRMTVA